MHCRLLYTDKYQTTVPGSLPVFPQQISSENQIKPLAEGYYRVFRQLRCCQETGERFYLVVWGEKKLNQIARVNGIKFPKCTSCLGWGRESGAVYSWNYLGVHLKILTHWLYNTAIRCYFLYFCFQRRPLCGSKRKCYFGLDQELLQCYFITRYLTASCLSIYLTVSSIYLSSVWKKRDIFDIMKFPVFLPNTT